jgi:hypothetical protein
MSDLATMSRPEVHDLLMAADRDRARIAYRGLREHPDSMRMFGVAWNRISEENDRRVAANRETPEYAEADGRFRACSARLREIDGDSRLRDRQGRRVSI